MCKTEKSIIITCVIISICIAGWGYSVFAQDFDHISELSRGTVKEVTYATTFPFEIDASTPDLIIEITDTVTPIISTDIQFTDDVGDCGTMNMGDDGIVVFRGDVGRCLLVLYVSFDYMGKDPNGILINPQETDDNCIHKWKEGASSDKLTWGVPYGTPSKPVYFYECVECGKVDAVAESKLAIYQGMYESAIECQLPEKAEMILDVMGELRKKVYERQMELLGKL